jgi:hypothetical protein
MLHLSPAPAASHNLELGLAARQPNFKTGITDTTEINGIHVLQILHT